MGSTVRPQWDLHCPFLWYTLYVATLLTESKRTLRKKVVTLLLLGPSINLTCSACESACKGQILWLLNQGFFSHDVEDSLVLLHILKDSMDGCKYE
jgi:hypothetical protein